MFYGKLKYMKLLSCFVGVLSTISTGNRGMWLYVKWRTFFQDYLDSIIWFKAQCE